MMKRIHASYLVALLAAVSIFATPADAQVAGWKADEAPQTLEKGLYEGALATITSFKEKDPGMSAFFDRANAYVVFPTVGKGGVGIGGAYGKGVLFQGGQAVGEASLSQVTIGFQWGGQAYSEIIFFESQADADRFKKSSYEVAAQASAVAATLGASRDVSYEGGVAIFTMAKGGLMYEATVGGQKFKFEEKAPPGS